MKPLLCTVVLGFVTGFSHGQQACFHSAREAALGAGVRDGQGFRLEGVTADRVGGGSWARMTRCGHPELPGTMVKVLRKDEGEQGSAGNEAGAVRRGVVLVATGAPVRVVREQAMGRLEMEGFALGDGGRGEWIQVRLAADGQARIVSAVVRADGLVEMESVR